MSAILLATERLLRLGRECPDDESVDGYWAALRSLEKAIEQLEDFRQRGSASSTRLQDRDSAIGTPNSAITDAANAGVDGQVSDQSTAVRQVSQDALAWDPPLPQYVFGDDDEFLTPYNHKGDLDFSYQLDSHQATPTPTASDFNNLDFDLSYADSQEQIVEGHTENQYKQKAEHQEKVEEEDREDDEGENREDDQEENREQGQEEGQDDDSHIDDVFSPMALDFDPLNNFSLKETEQWLSSHSSSFRPPIAEDEIADLTVDPQNLQTLRYDTRGAANVSQSDHDIPQPSETATPNTDTSSTSHLRTSNAINNQFDQSQHILDGDMDEGELRQVMDQFLTEGYAEEQAEEQAEAEIDMVREKSTTNIRKRKGGRKKRTPDGYDRRIPDEITRMPYYPHCSVEPETVYSLIQSKCSESVPVKTLSALTKLFFGLACPDGLREFREICLSERRDPCYFSPNLDLQQTVRALKQLEVDKSAVKSSRRRHRARLVDHRDMRVQKLREEHAKRSRRMKQHSEDHSDIRTLALRRIMMELYTDLGEEDFEYQLEYDSIKNQLRTGRHWHALKNRIPGGCDLLATLPRSGPYRVSDSEIERVTDSVFKVFLEILVELSGAFLKRVAAKINPILDAISTNEENGSGNGHSLPSITLRHKLLELFSCLEDELGLQLVMPEC